MKKLLFGIFISLLSFTTANSEISVGVSGTLGMMDAEGKETVSGSTNAGVDWGATSAGTRDATATAATTQSDTEDLVIAYGSIWAEGHLSSNIRAGINFVPYALQSETTENVRHDNCSHSEGHLNEPVSSQVCTSTSNKVDVELVNLAQLYLSYHTDNFFVKAGVMTADIETNENLATGSQYDDASLEGTFVGAGIERDFGTEMFVRSEINFTKFDDIKLTGKGSDNTTTIDVTDLGGINASVSVGKTF
jgi:hypothetical protein